MYSSERTPKLSYRLPHQTERPQSLSRVMHGARFSRILFDSRRILAVSFFGGLSVI